MSIGAAEKNRKEGQIEINPKEQRAQQEGQDRKQRKGKISRKNRARAFEELDRWMEQNSKDWKTLGKLLGAPDHSIWDWK